MVEYDRFMKKLPEQIRQTVEHYVCDNIIIFKPETYITGKTICSDDFHIIMPSSSAPETYFDGKKHDVQRGKIIAVNPGTTVYCSEGRVTKRYLDILIKPEFMREIMEQMELLGDLRFLNLANSFSNELLQTIRFFDNETSREYPSALLLDCLSVQIVTLILREFDTNLNRCVLDNYLSKMQIGDSYIKNAIEYMNVFYSSNITIDDICSSIHVSSSHFIRTFKQKTGLSPHKYLMEIRIKSNGTIKN